MEEESELDENGDSNRTMFSDAEGAAKYPFYALQKPVSETINANIKFFDSLEGFSTINVIGHSLNDIDLPYFEEIARSVKYAEWRVYCYRIEDHEHYLKQLIKCGVNCGSILIKTYDELPIE